MTPTGQALRMRLQLARLAVRHGVAPAPLRIEPLSAPTDTAMQLAGIAAANSVDSERLRFRPYAFLLPSMLKQPAPPLLYRHRAPAGHITVLEYDDRGRLVVTAVVVHPEARRCSHFSVCAHIRSYDLIYTDDRPVSMRWSPPPASSRSRSPIAPAMSTPWCSAVCLPLRRRRAMLT